MSKKEASSETKATEKKPWRQQHAYGSFVGGMNFESKVDKRNIAQQLNHLKDNLEEYLSDKRSIHEFIKKDSTLLNEKHSLQMAACIWFAKWFLGKFRLNTFIKTLEANPDGNRTGEKLWREYLNKDEKISEIEPKLYDQERLLLFDEALKRGKIVGGISDFRIFQHTYSLVKAIQRKLGDQAIHVSHVDKFIKAGKLDGNYKDADEAEKMVIAIAEEMHKRKRASNEQKTDQKDKLEPIIEDVTPQEQAGNHTPEEYLAMLENGEVKSTDLDLNEAKEVRELASGGVKGALTRHIKTLEKA